MSKGHNKKRNVGLIYEQVIKQSVLAITEDRPEDAKVYTEFLKRHFVKGSELLKEFKLFNAILATNGVSEKVADRVLELACESTRNINAGKLAKEKGVFINEANRLFGKNALFAVPVENFRALATVQSLLNEWKVPGTLFPADTARYENQLREFMMLEPRPSSLQIVEGIDDVSVKMFHKRFDDSYDDKFIQSQKDFLRSLTFGQQDEVSDLILATKKRVLELLLERQITEENSVLREKYTSVRENIQRLDPSDSSALARQLTMLQLIDELEDGNE